MRYMPVALLLALLPLGLWFLTAGEDAGIKSLSQAPRDPLLLVGIREFPSPSQIARIAESLEWLEVDPQALAARLESETLREFEKAYRRSVRDSCILVDTLSRKEDRSVRIHFSAVLQVRKGTAEILALRLEELIANRFGEKAQIEESPGVASVRGDEEGEVFHLSHSAETVRFSNSLAGLERLEAVARGELPDFSDHPDFGRLSERMEQPFQLFLYSRGETQLGLIPEFALLVRFEKDSPEFAWVDLKGP